jgi:translocation and assembly module TamB
MGVLLGATMTIVLTMPVWWPWVFRPLLLREGVHFVRYERQSYARFILTDVRFTNAAVELQAKRVEGMVPSIWLWRLWVAGGTNRGPYVRVTDWQLTLRDRPAKDGGQLLSFYQYLQQVELALTQVQKWVPRAELVGGTIQFENQRLEIPKANWERGKWVTQLAAPELRQTASLQLLLQAEAPHEIQLDSASLDLHSTIQLARGPSGVRVQATTLWLSNRVEARAQFDREGALPESAHVEAASFTVPARHLGLEKFQQVEGKFSLDWRTNSYALQLVAGARSLSPDRPSVDVVLRANGDLHSARIEQAHLAVPWLDADLTGGTRVKFSAPFLAEPAALKVQADLAAQPWYPARGRLQGQVAFRPGTNRFPAAAFTFSGTNLEVSNVQTKALQVDGAVDWPWLEMPKATIEFDDRSIASAAGRLNLEERTVQDGRLTIVGRFGQQWLPSGITYDSAKATVNFHGPLEKPVHSGEIAIEKLAAPPLRPVRLEASWRGEKLDLSQARVSLQAGASSVSMEGSVQLGLPEISLRLSRLTLRQHGDDKLVLQKPVQFAFRPRLDPGGDTRLRLDSLDWGNELQGLHLESDVTWPHRGHVAGRVRAIEASLFADFIDVASRPWAVGQLDFVGAWTNGPLQLELQLGQGRLEVDGASFSAEAKVRSEARGITVENFSIAIQNETVASARGFLPIALDPAAKNLLQVHPRENMQLDVTVQPKANFWNQITESRGLRLHEPEVEAHVTGQWAAPRANLRLRARNVRLSSVPPEVPPIENLALDLQVEPALIRVASLTLSVAKQPVTLNGELPLPDDFWARLPKHVEVPDWRKATARLQMDRVDFAALTPFLSDLWAPGGILQADVSLRPRGEFSGQLTIREVNTRPLENVGPVRNIELVSRFDGRNLHLKSTAAIGGQTVQAEGVMDLGGKKWFEDRSWPPYQIRILGTNIPLTRRVEAIVRANVNMTLTNAPGKPVIVSGAVHLRNSFYLQDLTALVPDGVSTPRRRPPYFSIDRDPFADWRLDVAVIGQESLKVRTPLFKGEVSPNVHLRGTLKEPVATGDIRVKSGTIRLPFATLPVTQGFATLRSDNPYQPQLFVLATARVFGYDVKLEVTGPASNPVIQFSSTPPLNSEQILLMLMAGELPRTDFSLTGQQRVERLALFFGRSVLSDLGFLGEANRLTIRSDENLSEAGKTTYSVEYKLSDDWAVIGEYDRFNDVNFMLQWRIYPW